MSYGILVPNTPANRRVAEQIMADFGMTIVDVQEMVYYHGEKQVIQPPPWWKTHALPFRVYAKAQPVAIYKPIGALPIMRQAGLMDVTAIDDAGYLCVYDKVTPTWWVKADDVQLVTP